MKFSNILTQWYLLHKRDLPWRNTTNPYFIWLSEIILQQTRVDQGMAYYFKFIETFPTVQDLANSSEEEVLNLWQGLGYYSRARNLHFSAKYIVDECKGEFPNTYSEIIKLKGVGDYTASAIASICFNESTAVVDGNVYRVLARYFAIETPINSTKGIKEFKLLAQELIDSKNAAMHNQAIMEFGARMCKPQNPDCSICPLNESCVSLQKKKVKLLPIKEKKIKIKKRHLNYVALISSDKKTILKKRVGKGIWQNLYEFKLIESESKIEKADLLSDLFFTDVLNGKQIELTKFNNDEIVHKLSHQHLFCTFWVVELDGEMSNGVHWNSIDDYPVPILIHNFVEELKRSTIFSIFE
ncbi:A/G-specific adenine glycosylase [Urechidicola vernalis]|uniref:Adenine DNA glycosylase n=1 Tax=Urechidicola vernalis TaxID=3075600 RepID=A0ABU2Y708_9FLAO|nr:A/G-specific adenine glycosylase [Urechidicola sp. P050]MDT0553981.1 A/G-specific adenine glycosylase [Urechidicola sp. P050]